MHKTPHFLVKNFLCGEVTNSQPSHTPPHPLLFLINSHSIRL